ncbi:MAG: condensation domain-containing protein, partial [Acidobacteriota bacterium]|nr:condensation domain-containing protein [Acidobacteriota bacterium]
MTFANNEIIPCQRPDKLPVSFIQEQVIGAEIAGLYDPAKMRVNCPALSYLIKGNVNTSALDKALCEIARRHEILRTNYIVIDKQIFQNINDVSDTVLQVSDLRKLAQNDRKKESERILTELTTRPFSFFDNKLMLSATLIIAGDEEYILTIITNHIATDGLSMMILQRELFALYQAFSFNVPSPLPELPIQYVDFAIWERKHYSGEFLEKRLDYWRKIPNTINTFLPVDHVSASASYCGDTVPLSILPELAK